MSLLQNSNAIETGGYPINNSLRFQSASSTYMSRTPASAGNRQKWTWSGWVKRGTLGSAVGIFGAYSSGTTYAGIFFDANNCLNYQDRTAPTNNALLTSSAVYRDPSAWYHIIVAVDTTQATASDRIKIYVNGLQVTAFSTSTYYSLNASGYVNNNILHELGSLTGGSFLDGYLAEVNFIDGQALTPSSFGETNALTGQWVAKKYTGTYGINGFYLKFIDGAGTGSNSFTYSEDFTNASWTKLNSTISASVTTAPNGASNGTKLVENTTNGPHELYKTITESNVTRTLSVYAKISDVSRPYIALNMSDFLAYDVSAVFNLSTGQLTSVTSSNANYTGISTSISSVGNGWYRCALTATKGSVNPNNNLRIMLCDASGNILYAGSGTTLGTFIWGAQAELSGTVGPYYTTGASAQASTLLLGKDYSVQTGGYNNWTLTNFTRSAGVSDCWMKDVPSGNGGASGTQPSSNYAVLNPLASNTTVSNGNLRITNVANSVQYNAIASMAITTPIYFEHIVGVSQTASMNVYFGIGSSPLLSNYTSYLGASSNGWAMAYYPGAIAKVYNASSTTLAAITPSVGDVLQVAVDPANGKVWFGRNGTWYGSGDPATGANPAYTGLPSTVYAVLGVYSSAGAATNYYNVNFGQRSFAYTPPSGFKALCTANLPASTIVKGNQYMDATLYTGTSANATITNAGSFKPDLVVTKARSNAYPMVWMNSIAGAAQYLRSDSTAAEATFATGLTSFNSNGFGLGADTTSGAWNYTGVTYVGWQWQAGQGTTSSNTNGSITSTVSVSTTAGFSVVTWTGTGANATVGHGLGVAPKMVIVKSRSSGGASTWSWIVYHASLANTEYLLLNSTAAKGTAATVWNSTSPTSTVFSIGTDATPNSSTVTYVAYCFAEIAGFSKFGSYTGNGSTDGPFVYLGFRPKYVLVKLSSGIEDWRVYDSVRSTYNVMGEELYPDLSGAATSVTFADFLSNGFKLRTTSSGSNTNGATYIYMAFAENPFAQANAR